MAQRYEVATMLQLRIGEGIAEIEDRDGLDPHPLQFLGYLEGRSARCPGADRLLDHVDGVEPLGQGGRRDRGTGQTGQVRPLAVRPAGEGDPPGPALPREQT